MDSTTTERGLRYEELLMRAFELEFPDVALGANRRIYYLLYYINIGFDLRGTGYTHQFLQVKENVATAFQQLLELELHRHERIWVKQLQKELLRVHDEDALDRVIIKGLDATSRLARMEMVLK